MSIKRNVKTQYLHVTKTATMSFWYFQDNYGEDTHSSPSSMSIDSSLGRQVLEQKDSMPGVINTILACQRSSSHCLYDPYLIKWDAYCRRCSVDPMAPSVANLVNFRYHKRNQAHIGGTVPYALREPLSVQS